MRLGAYTASLHDRSLPETLKILRDLGLTSAEINAGGFIPAPHLPIGQLLSGAAAREEYLGLFEPAGIALTGLNVNGNPLNPDPEVGPKHAEDLRRAASLLRSGSDVGLGGEGPQRVPLPDVVGAGVERLAHATQLASAEAADLPHQPVLLLGEPLQIGPLLAGVEGAALLLGVATMRDRERGVDQPDHDVDLPLGAHERGVNGGRMPASGDHQGRGVGCRSRAARRGRGRDPPYSAEQGGEEE